MVGICKLLFVFPIMLTDVCFCVANAFSAATMISSFAFIVFLTLAVQLHNKCCYRKAPARMKLVPKERTVVDHNAVMQVKFIMFMVCRTIFSV